MTDLSNLYAARWPHGRPDGLQPNQLAWCRKRLKHFRWAEGQAKKAIGDGHVMPMLVGSQADHFADAVSAANRGDLRPLAEYEAERGEG